MIRRKSEVKYRRAKSEKFLPRRGGRRRVDSPPCLYPRSEIPPQRFSFRSRNVGRSCRIIPTIRLWPALSLPSHPPFHPLTQYMHVSSRVVVSALLIRVLIDFAFVEPRATTTTTTTTGAQHNTGSAGPRSRASVEK